MINKEFIFSLDFINRTNMPNIELIQGDVETNIFYITLLKNRMPVDLNGCTLTITFSKADGNVVVAMPEIIEFSMGRIKYLLDSNVISFPFQVKASVEIYENLKRLTSTTFNFNVKKQLNDGSAMESTTEYPVLNQLISEVQALKDIQISQEIDQGDPFDDGDDFIFDEGEV